jgi:catechol 2,3-dioxygenase-like lactoylglutathione lyase family enzyme
VVDRDRLRQAEAVLNAHDLVAFVATTDLERARAFYVDVLGLAPVEVSPFACVVDAHGTTLRITLVDQLVAAPYTVLGWSVPDLDATIDALTARGVTFRRYDGMDQDDRGAWTAPSGDRIAWFGDPDGNTLSLQAPPG